MEYIKIQKDEFDVALFSQKYIVNYNIGLLIQC